MAKKEKEEQKTGEELIATQTELMQKNIGTELVEKAVQGDESAFEKLYKLTYRYVYAVAKYYLSDDEDIRDAIQDTFTRVYKNLSKLNDPDAFAWWLRKIAENCSKTVRERKAVDSDLELFEAEFVADDGKLRTKDVELDITEVLSELQPDQAELLTHIYYDKLTVAEIARMKELPDSTVRSRVKSAEKKLREMLRVRGIEKPVYGGEFVAMVTTAFRNAIGTDLLSATVAQEILDNIRGGDEKRGAVIGAVATKERNRAVLRLAGIMVAVAVFFALLIFGIFKISDAIANGNIGANGRGNGEKTPFFETFFGGSSSEDASSDESSSTEDTSFEPSSTDDNSYAPIENSSDSSTGRSSDNSSDTSSNNTSTTSSNKTSGTSSTAGNQGTNTGSFTPDCTIAEYNTIGKRMDQSGLTTQGDWIYYTNSDGIVAANKGLFKVRKDGSGLKKIREDSVSQINVVGEYIYFLSQDEIKKIRTDGKNEESLGQYYAEDLVIAGDYAYFASYGNAFEDGDLSYYRLNLKTREKTMLIEKMRYDLTIVWADSDRMFIVDSENKTISRFIPETKKTELWYSNVDVNGSVTGHYLVSSKIYDLKTKRTPIGYEASNVTAYVFSTYYYKIGNKEYIYISYTSHDDTPAPMVDKSRSYCLSDMSFKECSIGFSREENYAYKLSNIYDGYVYAFNRQGYLNRKQIDGSDTMVYN